jgi:hypothetical protein
LNSPQEFHSHSGTHWHGSIDRRKSTKTNVSYQASNEASSSIWNPIHGISQPFCLVGFLKENLTEKMSPVTKKEANPIVIVKDVQVITAFRIFGKYIDIDDTLRMFREICELESTPFSDKDISRFAIYKENEITMVLENFFTSKEQAAAAFSSSNTPSRADESHSISVVKNENEVQANEPHEFRLIDLQAQNGQRFACISVFHENNSHVIESMLVSVYQCFPTAQSALRFAKQINATSLANATLLIVPLFEWIRLDMLEHFDAKSPELEQNLEKAMYSNSGKYYSTSKARKDAMKRSEGLLPK